MPSETLIELPYQFDPWPHQEEWFTAFYDHGIRRFFEVVHRRAGKDLGFVNLTVDQMTQRVGNYYHVFPQRQRARLIVWEGISTDGKRYIDHFPPELIYRKLEQDMMISLRHPDDDEREGAIYRCLGSDRDVYLLVGGNPVGVIWSEFPEINPRMRTLVLPILRRNRGWEAIVCTPRGRNHAYKLFNRVRHSPAWHVSYLTIKDTVDHDGKPLVTDEDVQADIEAGLSEEEAAQEYYLSWDTPMPGAYYAQEFRQIDKQGRIRHVPYDPALPVYTSWDLGMNDSNAIWYFQPAGHEVRFIDYDEDSSVALAYDDDPQRDGWLDRVRAKPYCYDHSKLPQPLTEHAHEVHYGPHDLDTREYSTGKTRYTFALQHGFRFTMLPHPGPGGLHNGIAAARALLARAVFDAEKCEQGIEALRGYRRKKDEKTGAYHKTPDHTWESNGADSFRYAAVGLMPPRPPKETKPEHTPGTFAYQRKQAIKARRAMPATSRRLA
jgi:phage terminase large subunit